MISTGQLQAVDYYRKSQRQIASLWWLHARCEYKLEAIYTASSSVKSILFLFTPQVSWCVGGRALSNSSRPLPSQIPNPNYIFSHIIFNEGSNYIEILLKIILFIRVYFDIIIINLVRTRDCDEIAVG